MDANMELLNYVFQNSEMGVVTIRQILELTRDSAFKQQLQSQLNEYETINQWAKEKIERQGCEEKEIGMLKKVSSYLMINMNTLLDKSPSHIAQMMIQGSTMGIIEGTKNLKEHSDAAEDIQELMNKLLKFEQNNLERLKAFL